MKVCVISANLGNFDKPVKYVDQTAEHTFCLFTDKNLPSRFNAMTPRLQARIPKMFGWQLVPGFDFYVWLDASCRFSHENSIKWLLDKVKQYDIAVFKHPDRDTVQEEADYLKYRLKIKCPYITPRYENEWIDEHLGEVDPSRQLYASTCFIYRNFPRVQKALKQWWYYTSRYHCIDQLGFPEAIKDLNINVIPDDYTKCKYLEYMRNK